MATILVTGGAGFIGSNLCRFLLDRNHTVHAIDNLITSNHKNIESFLQHPHFSFHCTDIGRKDFVDTFSNIHIDAIYHLACPTGVPNLTKLAEEMARTCSCGTLNVLELARLHNAHILYTSSAEAYGDPLQTPQKEQYTGNVDTIGSRSAYEEGKRFSETCVALYARKYNLRAITVRVFNTYGPGMSLNDTRVIPQFIKSIKEQKPLRIYGDGMQTRSHLYVDDLIRGFATLMEKGISGEIYNVGNDVPMTIRELAELMTSLTNHAAGITYEEHFINDHNQRCPSTEKVRTLGWKPEVSIHDGLSRMIALHIPQQNNKRYSEVVSSAQ